MRAADLYLLFKKISIGLIVAAVPLLIIIGGLHLTRIVLEIPAKPKHANPTRALNPIPRKMS